MTADLLAVTPEIIQRYNRPGPRYTSYPTVPVWSEGYFSEDYAACLQKEGLNEQPISLYLHIPFCRQLCTFCGCNKYITNNQEIVERYLDALDQGSNFLEKELCLCGIPELVNVFHEYLPK